jgi:hypothetical protein
VTGIPVKRVPTVEIRGRRDRSKEVTHGEEAQDAQGLIHVVQYSTGAGSAEVAVRVVEEHGVDNVVLLTADTTVEDVDNWRFAEEAWKWLGEPEWIRVCDGRSPMQVGRDVKVVPNDRMAVCSRILKREILRRYIEEHYAPERTLIYEGYDWTEPHRFERAIEPWKPYELRAPLLDPPYVQKAEILDAWKERGIKPPRLYDMGFAHANCGGACVRSGQAQWALLFREDPALYLEWEAEEEVTRQMLDKDVAILRDRRFGKVRPMTLREFRQERLHGGDYDRSDWGACGCDPMGASAVSEVEVGFL